MKTSVEELLREGMERFASGIAAPAGLARTAGQLHRRRLAVRATVASGAAAVTAAAVVLVATGAGGHPAPAGGSQAQARTAAYVIKRVENALAGQHLVFYGQTTSNGGPGPTWAYGPQHRTVEFFHGRPYWAQGTALIHGKLTGVYVTYYNHKWSVVAQSTPASACSAKAALAMGGPPVPTNHWADFINATLACGAAKVTGHVRIDGIETTKITGSPVKVRLSPDYAKAVGEKWARARWILYVNPTTYLPVRIYGETQTFGGPAPGTRFASVTGVQWLKPTKANIAKTLVTIPTGFHQVGSPADQ
jgi:hypothetical protein